MDLARLPLPLRRPAPRAAAPRHTDATEVKARVPGAIGMVVLVPDDARAGRPPHADFIAEVLCGYRLGTRVFHDSDSASPQPVGAEAAALARQLAAMLESRHAGEAASRLHLGLFGTGSGAPVALLTAAQHPGWVSAVVAFGGDLQPVWLMSDRLQVPVLRIVGDTDARTLGRERQGLRGLTCMSRLEVVPGADLRLGDPGAAQTVAHLAGSWLAEQLRPVGST